MVILGRKANANMAKVVVSDLDSTLLNDSKSISRYTIETVDRLRKKGIFFVIATARPIS